MSSKRGTYPYEYYSPSVVKFFFCTLNLEAWESGESEILKKLIERFPSLAKERDGKNDLPIHILLWHFYISDRHDIISTIIHLHPEAMKVKDNQNRLPLHLAVSSWCPNSIIKQIIDLYPEALLHPDLNGVFAFHGFVSTRFTGHNRNKLAAHVIRSYPRFIQNIDRNGNYPLHIAERNELIFEQLLGSSSLAVFRANNNGDYPLHCICRGSNFNAINMLLDLYPMAAKMRNTSSCYPLHIICCNNYYGTTRSVVFRKLLNIYPAATSHCNIDGDYPLHLACLHHSDWDELKPLIESNISILRKPNKAGCYPLHLLCKSIGPFEDPCYVRKVIVMWPAAINLPNGAGQTPVHILCTKWSSKVLQEISQYCTNMRLKVNIIDNNGNTPLHLAVSKIKESLCQREVLDYLLSDVFIDTKHRNFNGHRPLDIAYQKQNEIKYGTNREQGKIIISRLENFSTMRKQLSLSYIVKFFMELRI